MESHRYTNHTYLSNSVLIHELCKKKRRRRRKKERNGRGRVNIVKMSLWPKAIYRFSTTPIKLPMVFFTELEQIISQSVWKHKRPQIAKSILIKKEWRDQPAWLQTTLQSYSHQNSLVLAQRNIDQWNQIEGPEINPCIYGHLIFDKGGKHIQ